MQKMEVNITGMKPGINQDLKTTEEKTDHNSTTTFVDASI
jgi:hypothetical protein